MGWDDSLTLHSSKENGGNHFNVMLMNQVASGGGNAQSEVIRFVI